ncbi:unnamed protein product [Coccothraustes coccothraustes]
MDPWRSPWSERLLCGSRPAGPAVRGLPGSRQLGGRAASSRWVLVAAGGRLALWAWSVETVGMAAASSTQPSPLSGWRTDWTLGAAQETFLRPWRGPPVLPWPCPSQLRPARPGSSRGPPCSVQPGYARGCGRSPKGLRAGRGVPCHRRPEPQRRAGMVRG